VLSRAFLSDTLRSAQRVLEHLSTSLTKADAAVHDMPTVRIDRNPGEATEGLVVRYGQRSPAGHLPDSLTPREVEVLRLMASGRTNFAIGRELAIAEGTVKQHVKHVLHKLAVGNRAEAVAVWFQAGGDVERLPPSR